MKNFWEAKRVFITGATGLVGSWLTKKIVERGGYLVALVRDFDPQSELVRSNLWKKIHIVNGQLEDYATLERAINEHEIDTVLHLGAQTIVGTALRNPLPTLEANIRGSYNLFEACRRHKGLVERLLVASSDKAYGSSPVLPYSEEMPPLGRHPYDASKSCTDLLAQMYAHTYDLPVVIARCGNIYGGGDLNWSRLIPGTIRSLYLNQKPVVRSDGLFTRDYVFVQDAVEAYLLMAEHAKEPGVRGEAFNFGPQTPLNVLQVIEKLSLLMGKSHIKPIILDQAKAEIRDQYLLSEKAKKVLGWHPKYTLEQGLRETIDWYLEFLKAPV